MADLALTLIMAVWGSSFAVLRGLMGGAAATPLSAPWSSEGAATLLGDWLTVGCALVFAGHIVALGRVAPRHPVLPLLLLQLAATGALAGIAGPLVEAQHFSNAPRLWMALVY